jgi:hypothetical protein
LQAAKIVASDNSSILLSGKIDLGDEARLIAAFEAWERGPIEVHLAQ